jgi:hypothetical protein
MTVFLSTCGAGAASFFHRYLTSRFKMTSSLYTWAVFKHGLHMETFGGKILHLSLASYRVGREIETYTREREEEMRKQQWGMTRALSMILHHWWLGEAL